MRATEKRMNADEYNYEWQFREKKLLLILVFLFTAGGNAPYNNYML